MPILCKRHRTADPLVVRLIPHAPVPISDDLATPMFDTAADNIAAPLRKLLDGLKVVHGLVHFGECDHRLRSNTENRLHIRYEDWPLRYRVRSPLVVEEQPNHAGINRA